MEDIVNEFLSSQPEDTLILDTKILLGRENRAIVFVYIWYELPFDKLSLNQET